MTIALLKLPIFVTLLITAACASGMARESLDTDQQHAAMPGVAITFDHFGQAITLGPTKLLNEPDSADAFTLPGNDIWLRLSNTSNVVITFLTESQYLRPLGEWDVMPDGTKRLSLRDGAQILAFFGVMDARGHQVPYGTDFHFGSRLKPGTSVFFSVPREALANGRSIYIEFETEDVATGKSTVEKHRIGFRESDLPAEAR